MPGKLGYSVISALRRMEAETKILVLSGYRGMESEVLAMGAHAFLPKTTPSKEILAALSRIIDP